MNGYKCLTEKINPVQWLVRIFPTNYLVLLVEVGRPLLTVGMEVVF